MTQENPLRFRWYSLFNSTYICISDKRLWDHRQSRLCLGIENLWESCKLVTTHSCVCWLWLRKTAEELSSFWKFTYIVACAKISIRYKSGCASHLINTQVCLCRAQKEKKKVSPFCSTFHSLESKTFIPEYFLCVKDIQSFFEYSRGSRVCVYMCLWEIIYFLKIWALRTLVCLVLVGPPKWSE